MLRAVSLFAVLFVTWLLLSGVYEPLLIAFGVASCLLAVLIARRMEIVDHEGHPVHLGRRVSLYWVWLGWEVVKSNIDVAKRIVAPGLPISPTVVTVKTSQATEIGQVTYANSITLTPGTISMRVGKDSIDVHALSRDAAAALEQGEMDRRVTEIEGGAA